MSRYYGDPSKPGYPSPEQIADYDRIADCDEAGHPPFTAADDPRRPLEQCPGCGCILRTLDRTEPDYDHAPADDEHLIRAAEAAYEVRLGLTDQREVSLR